MGESLELRKKLAQERRAVVQGKFLEYMLEHEIMDYRRAADAISKGDKTKAKSWRQRWRRWMKDPEFQAAIGEMSMMHLRGGLPAAVEALNRRAAKGNVPAIKLAMEAAGFWSPRTTHDHTGEIQVVLKGGHRPAPVVDEDTIIEADVVE